MTPKGPSTGHTHQYSSLEYLVELLNQRLTPFGGLASSQVGENPTPLLCYVGLHDLTEPYAGVASDLLNGAPVQRCNRLLWVLVVSWVLVDRKSY